MEKICIIAGTRPEIVKFSPLLRLMPEKDYYLIHTGQHYSYNMDRIFFEQLELKEPEFKLHIPHTPHQGKQTAKILEGIEKVLLNIDCSCVIVLGDTNSGLAGALAASKLELPIIHIEAGVRSYNRKMPEEINRIIIDHISTYLFVPSVVQRKILRSEGIQNGVYVVGDISYDAVNDNIKIARKKSHILQKLGLEKRNYYLLTLHRKENVDNKEKLYKILTS